MNTSQSSLRFLYFVVFVSGMTTLAIELTASRLLGNIFGTSNLVWANVIGLMLLYLTIGYTLGGRLADRSPHMRTFYTIILWGAFLSALMPLIARPILQFAARAFVGAEAALALGSFVAILILFSAPVTLLGMVSPFAIRLGMTTVQKAGDVAGRTYAISTVGSLVGTFLPVLYFIPEFGTMATFLTFSGLLFAVASLGMVMTDAKYLLRFVWMPLVIIALVILSPFGPLRPPLPNQALLYDGESAYNYIQVQEDMDGFRYLYLNEGQGIHSQWHPDRIYYQRTWDFFLAAPYFNDRFSPADMESVLIIGLAAGTIPRQHIAVYGNLPMAGIEIDPIIVEVAADYFDMNKITMPSLNVIVGDGRYEMNQLKDQYTVIAVDAYRPPYIPWHLTTVEFFQEVKARLTDQGVAVINVGRTNTDRRLVEALANTLNFVFPTVHAIDVPRSFNTILVATQTPTASGNLAKNAALLQPDVSSILAQVLQGAIAAQVPTQANDILFTDDRAPVETLVDSLVLNFLFSGELEDLR